MLGQLRLALALLVATTAATGFSCTDARVGDAVASAPATAFVASGCAFAAPVTVNQPSFLSVERTVFAAGLTVVMNATLLADPRAEVSDSAVTGDVTLQGQLAGASLTLRNVTVSGTVYVEWSSVHSATLNLSGVAVGGDIVFQTRSFNDSTLCVSDGRLGNLVFRGATISGPVIDPIGRYTRGVYAALAMSNLTVRLSNTSLSGLRVVGSQWLPESVLRRDGGFWYYDSSLALGSVAFELDAGVHFAGEGLRLQATAASVDDGNTLRVATPISIQGSYLMTDGVHWHTGLTLANTSVSHLRVWGCMTAAPQFAVVNSTVLSFFEYNSNHTEFVVLTAPCARR